MKGLGSAVKNDPEFLCRCAPTYNWDVLIQFCSLHLQRTDPTDKCALLSAKRQFLETDQWGNTPLHAACYNRPPLSVVRSILDAARTVDRALATHSSSSSSSSSDDDDQLHHQQHHDDDNNSLHLLHLKRARDGSTALQVACACGSSLQVIQALLEAPHGGSVVTATDSMGATPLSDLVVQYELERKSPPNVRSSKPLQDIYSIRKEDAPIFRLFWDKVMLLFESAWSSSTSRGSPLRVSSSSSSCPSVLHGAANVAEACPEVITDLVGRCFPHFVSLSSTTPEGSGTTALHVALQRRKQSAHKKARERRNYMIHMLIEKYPIAVHVLPSHHHKCRRRSFLCSAIDAGLHWSSTSSGKMMIGPVQALWRLSPSALTDLDRDTGFCPFLLAAISRASLVEEGNNELGSVEGKKDEQHERLVLDTVYNLLRLDPRALSEESIHAKLKS